MAGWEATNNDNDPFFHGDRQKVFKGPDPKPIKKPKGGGKKK